MPAGGVLGGATYFGAAIGTACCFGWNTSGSHPAGGGRLTAARLTDDIDVPKLVINHRQLQSNRGCLRHNCSGSPASRLHLFEEFLISDFWLSFCPLAIHPKLHV